MVDPRPQPAPGAPSAAPARLARFANVVALAGALAAPALFAAPAPHWVPAGEPGQLMQYFVDADSVRQQRDVTYYRVFGRGVQAVSRETNVEAEVGVHCGERKRVAYITTVRWRDGVRTSTASEMQPVAAGSREAVELDTACQLAEDARRSSPAVAGAGAAQLAVSSAAAPAHGNAGAPRTGVRWSGTAFAVSRNVLVTNHHVVRGCARVRVGQGDAVYDARVLAADAGSDLAALTVADAALVPLEFAQEPRELGEAIAVLGYPLANVLGSDLRVTTGIVSALSGVAGDRRHLQISAPVQPGNSGGPVLNEHGQVSAVVVTKMDLRMNAENISFAVALPTVQQFLSTHSIGYRSARAAGPALTVAQAVKRAAPSVLLVQCM